MNLSAADLTCFLHEPIAPYDWLTFIYCFNTAVRFVLPACPPARLHRPLHRLHSCSAGTCPIIYLPVGLSGWTCLPPRASLVGFGSEQSEVGADKLQATTEGTPKRLPSDGFTIAEGFCNATKYWGSECGFRAVTVLTFRDRSQLGR